MKLSSSETEHGLLLPVLEISIEQKLFGNLEQPLLKDEISNIQMMCFALSNAFL